MTRQRAIGLALVVLAGATLAYTSRTYVFPAAAILLAVAGAPGRVGLRLSRERNLIFSLLLAAIFGLKWRFAPYDPPDVIAGVFFPLAHAAAQFFVLLAAAQFYVHRADPLPPALPLMTTIVLLCAGDVILNDAQAAAYLVLAFAAATLTALYFAAGRSAAPAAGKRWGKWAVLVVLLAGMMAGGAVGSEFAYRYHKSLSRWFRMMTGFVLKDTRGFSLAARLDSMRTIRTGELADDIALRVFAERAPGYLKGAAYERYERREWRMSDRVWQVRPSPVPPPDLPDPPPGYRLFLLRRPAGPIERTDVWPDPTIGEGMFAPSGTAAMAVPAETLELDACGAVNSKDLKGGLNYVAFTDSGAAAVEPHSPEGRQLLTVVPGDLEPPVRELAQRLFADCRTTAEKIAAVEAHFRDHYEYGLGIQVPPRREPLSYFLLARPAAHCEYFASGAAVLLRLGGVPTRYVTGFVAQERSDYGGYWIARYKDAHAWVEAYDERRGWVIVEATPPAGRPHAAQRGVLAYAWDRFKLRLQELRVLFEQEGAVGLLKWLLAALGGLLAWMLTSIPGLVITGAVVALLLRKLLRKLRRRRARRPAPVAPAVAALHRLLRQMDRRLARRGLRRRPDETLHQFARRLAREMPATEAPAGIPAWYRRYARIRYGGDVAEPEIDRLRSSMPPSRSPAQKETTPARG